MLNSSIEYLKGVGSHRADVIKKELGISNILQLINFFPRKYIDRSKIHKISELNSEHAYVQILGKIESYKEIGKHRKKRLEAVLSDGDNNIKLVWFKGTNWIKDKLSSGKSFLVFGKLNKFKNEFSLIHPELEEMDKIKTQDINVIRPVYPSTELLAKSGVSNKVHTNIIDNALESHLPEFEENLSLYLTNSLGLISKKEAVFNIHFPKNLELLQKAQFRLKFEEFFFLQLSLLKRKQQLNRRKGLNFEKVGDYFNKFYKEILPFELTNAQKKVIKEIRQDTGSGFQMNRLLQGDVGSGKTVVALMTALLSIDNGYQSLLMAPTEVLANQHYGSMLEQFEKLGLQIALLTGNTKASIRNEILEKTKSGETHLLVGTHALLENRVEFKNLGLGIIDEQHKFGVAQRSKIWEKNKIPPHILVMSATPIPRTLAMTLYGDLDISIIDELPPGRKAINTFHKYDNNRLEIIGFIKKSIDSGRQVYIIYPLIEESDYHDYKDLMDGYESIIREFPLPKYSVGVLHGKMKAADKDFEMKRFAEGQTQILVSTTVIEVGVNVPNATVMIIESAERFGLSQLHQLRGRVGRGSDQSFCIMVTSFKLSKEAKTRINAMKESNDGFKIAEVDMELRGPGNIMGVEQSGALKFNIADLIKDQNILKLSRNYAINILQKDPKLISTENIPIKKYITNSLNNFKNWEEIS